MATERVILHGLRQKNGAEEVIERRIERPSRIYFTTGGYVSDPGLAFKVGDTVIFSDVNVADDTAIIRHKDDLTVVPDFSSIFVPPTAAPTTAVAQLKGRPLVAQPSARETIDQWLRDKQWFRPGVRALGPHNLGNIMHQWVLHSDEPITDALRYLLASSNGTTHTATCRPYRGTPDENLAIDAATYQRGDLTRFSGVGLRDTLKPLTNLVGAGTPLLGIPNIHSTPICVIGNGPAGAMVHYGLRVLGFNNLTLYDRQGTSKGIWTQENVYKGSRNNPRELTFLNVATLKAAPGDGASVRTFVDSMAQTPSKAALNGVTPKPFAHQILFTGGATPSTYPIVINCMGVGKPADVDPRRMKTTNGSKLGVRWQQILTAEQLRRKRLLFVGLGNSTAEMLAQMHKFIDQGVDTDYRVLTHYPEDAVRNPASTVLNNGKDYRVFRDPTTNLVDYQGDLAASRADYFRALHSGRLISGVNGWKVINGGHHDQKGVLAATSVVPRRNLTHEVADIAQLYTLIGYEHSADVLKSFGIDLDAQGGPKYDYDGEFFHGSGENRKILKGYFGLGAVLESEWNPNAVVIPGMLHRIGDLLFGVILRAAEYQLSKEL